MSTAKTTPTPVKNTSEKPAEKAPAKAKDKEPKVIKVRNPNIQVKVTVEGHEGYETKGVRASTMKATRAWIRARGLSVTMDGVEKTEQEGKGEGGVDLLTFTFSKKCLADNDAEFKQPQTRGRKADTDGEEKPEAAKKVKATKPAPKKVEETGAAPSDW